MSFEARSFCHPVVLSVILFAERAFQVDFGVAQFAGGAGAELQARHVFAHLELGCAGGAVVTDDAHREDGQVVQFHVLAVQNQLLDAGHHFGQHPFDDAGRERRVVFRHVLGQRFEVQRFVDDGAGIPHSLAGMVLAGDLNFSVENHKLID